MVKRYYCDYCDRYFVDDLSARKKHLSSTSHIRNRNDFYKHFRDVNDFIKEELKKPLCKKFKATGMCAFGENCCNTHYTVEQLSQWKQKVEEEQRLKKEFTISQLPTLDDWIRDWKGNKDMYAIVNSNLNYVLNNLDPQSVPPSLRVPELSTIHGYNRSLWGK